MLWGPFGVGCLNPIGNWKCIRWGGGFKPPWNNGSPCRPESGERGEQHIGELIQPWKMSVSYKIDLFLISIFFFLSTPFHFCLSLFQSFSIPSLPSDLFLDTRCVYWNWWCLSVSPSVSFLSFLRFHYAQKVPFSAFSLLCFHCVWPF